MSLTISIPRPILEGMFDECERYLEEETGGRLLGFFAWHGTDLHIDVKAVLPAGPNARRSRVSFFQDGDYQEQLFRGVEKSYPEIRHLGNWHTHHCNGLRTLSIGDCETYRRIVNNPKHAQDFFYAVGNVCAVFWRKCAFSPVAMGLRIRLGHQAAGSR